MDLSKKETHPANALEAAESVGRRKFLPLVVAIRSLA